MNCVFLLSVDITSVNSLVEVHQLLEIKSGMNRRSQFFFGGVRQRALAMICYPR
jgi:hypothetical protein